MSEILDGLRDRHRDPAIGQTPLNRVTEEFNRPHSQNVGWHGDPDATVLGRTARLQFGIVAHYVAKNTSSSRSSSAAVSGGP